MKTIITLALILSLGLASGLQAKKAAALHRFILTMPHTPEECGPAMDRLKDKDKKLYGQTEWGCDFGAHVGYLTVEAKDKAAALALVPKEERAKTTVQEVSRMSVQEMKEMHKM